MFILLFRFFFQFDWERQPTATTYNDVFFQLKAIAALQNDLLLLIYTYFSHFYVFFSLFHFISFIRSFAIHFKYKYGKNNNNHISISCSWLRILWRFFYGVIFLTVAVFLQTNSNRAHYLFMIKSKYEHTCIQIRIECTKWQQKY